MGETDDRDHIRRARHCEELVSGEERARRRAVFGRRPRVARHEGDWIKLAWWDGTGPCLLSRRLENGRFSWPAVHDGVMRLTGAVAVAQAEADRLAAAEVEAGIVWLNAIITAFQRHRFGARPEKLGEDRFELGLEELGTAIAGEGRDRCARFGRIAGAPRKVNRGALPAHLERVEPLVDIESKTCRCRGGVLHAIGEDAAGGSTWCQPPCACS